MKPRLLDLFCGAGGAAMGYHRAGFDVVGVDIKPQPNYPFEFAQSDVLEVPYFFMLDYFDAIHASPPCQAHSRARHSNDHVDLIREVRIMLEDAGMPFVIENVEGAPLLNPVTLCGSSFGLEVRRHRLFETNWPIMVPPCQHGSQGRVLGVYGHPGGRADLKHHRGGSANEWREAMDMPWATAAECAQAIPPAYTEFIGTQLLAHIQAVAA